MDPSMVVGNLEKTGENNAVKGSQGSQGSQGSPVVESFSGGAPSGLRCMVGMPCAAPRCPELASWWLADPCFEVTGGAWVCLHHSQNGVGSN